MNKEIGERIKKLRTNHGMTQTELAMKVGYSGKDMISKVEAGKVDLTRSRLIRIAEALYVSPLYLFNGSESVSEIGTELPPITAAEKHLEKYNRLDAEDKARIDERIEMLLEADKYKKGTTNEAM